MQLKVQLNLACADEFVDPAREELDRLHAVEQQGLEADLSAFFAAEVDVFVDGIQVEPVVERFEVFEADPSLVSLFPQFGARALTTVRIDLGYSAKSAPEDVRIVWRPFPPDLASAMPGQEPAALEVLARVAAGGTEQVVPLSPDAPELTWNAAGARLAESVRFLAVPETPQREPVTVSVASLACLGLALLLALVWALTSRGGSRGAWKLGALGALLVASWASRDLARVTLLPGGAQLPTPDEALAVFVPLHANIYRAFDYSAASDVYDALERSVEGALLERLYEEVYASLIQDEAEGAVGRVQRVELLESEIGAIESDAAGNPTFEIVARWQIEGAVFHWGHSHWRTQQARARYQVVRGAHGWRIAASEMLEQFVVSAVPGGPTSKQLSDEDAESVMPEEL